MTETTRVLVSIINWNNNQATTECLESLARIPLSAQPDIHMIDNHSERQQFDIPGMTLGKLKSVKVIKNKSNKGFAGAHNDSLRYALKNGYDYVCLINNDTELIDPKVFDKLTDALRNNSSAIAAAPTILSDKQGTVWYAGGDINRQTSTVKHRGVGQIYRDDKTVPVTVSFLSGCCIGIDVAKLRASKTLLSDEFFMYWEDADWCAQVTKAGYELLYVPDATILHNVSSSLGQRSAAYAYYIIRNHILFIRRNTSVVWKPLSYFVVLLTAAKYELHAIPGSWKHFVAIEKALLMGWRDGLLNRTGRRKDPS